MNPAPLDIAVIIPAYNSASTIAQTLDSVASQTHRVKQIIVVDDASPDHTLKIITQWQQQNPDTKIECLPLCENHGPAHARNHGIRNATSRWIAFLDADDAWLPWAAATLHQTINQSPHSSFICAHTCPMEAPAPDTPSDPIRVSPLNRQTLVSRNLVATSTVLVERQRLLDLQGFDEQFIGPEDYDLWLRLLAQSDATLIKAPVTRYRTTVGSLSMDDRTFLPQVLRVLRKAFAPEGALADLPQYRRQAFAEQFVSASWMAYHRGARPRAITLLIRSWLRGPATLDKEHTDPRHRLKLLIRYLTPSPHS